MTALSRDVTLIAQSLTHKESQLAIPAHSPRRNGEIKVLVQEVERHLPGATRN
jgi:hypothetical protein